MDLIEQGKFQKLLNRNILLPLAFGLLSVIFFVGIISYLLSLTRWVERSDATVTTANIMLNLMVDQESAMRGFLITRNDEYLWPYQRANELLPDTVDKLQKMLNKNASQQQRLEAILEAHERWHDYAEKAIALRGRNVDAPDIVSPLGKQLMDRIRTLTGALLAEQADLKAVHSDNARAFVIALVSGFFVLSLVLSGILAQLGRRQMIGLVSSYEKLLHDLDQQNAALHDEEWLRIGEIGLAEQIIGQLPLPILCQNVLGYLAERIGILVGALYVSSGDDYFRREANYGFSKGNAQREQQFARREGLVGQAAAENKIIHLSEVPLEYLKVSSGLGEVAPLHVLLVPINAESSTVAVLELGFFRAVEPRDLVFLERISENIGAAIVAAIYRRRLHDALLEMQQLNEELQSQQEELRAANEELEEQSQILEESQQRLENQHAELALVNQALYDNNEELRATRGLLEERALQLEQASRYKSEFLANMSHELRTPLNSALILSKLLADNAPKNLTDEQVRFATAIHSAGKDLLTLINDVLDLAKVEAGKIDIAPDEAAIAKIVDALRIYFEPMAAEKNLEFSLSVAPDVPAKIRTDRQRLEQILRNLLSNAFKFTAHGSVRLSVMKAADDALGFAVSDSGIGIREDAQELIFEPFRQVDAANNRKYGGVGLGLSISRDLARLLGGTLTVRSTVGEGSTFTLTLPTEFRDIDIEAGSGAVADIGVATSVSAAIMAAVPSLSSIEQRDELTARVIAPIRDFSDDRETLIDNGRTILVVEDEISFARILYDLAHELKYDCVVATSAEEAFTLATQYRPCAILLDMKLPDHSGLSVLARLKAEPLTRHIPVYVISVEERRGVALRMGAVGYVLKPVTHEQLRELFASIETHIEKNLAKEMKRVLIVEDFARQSGRADNIESMARLISANDVNATTVATGEQALQLLKEHRFDCMVVDFDLPDMSASQLLAHMTAAQMDSLPPVVVRSTRNLSREEEDALLRHSYSIVVKGVRTPERLLDEVTLFLHRVEAGLSEDKQLALRRFRERDRVFASRTILVVDDDARNIFALTSILEGRGAKVEVGRNGFDAIKKLSESAQIDLILMDIMMPEMDGYQAIEKIRQDRKFAKLPIIAVTAKAMRDDQERCLRAGANDYIAKPVHLDRLTSLINIWLPQVQRI